MPAAPPPVALVTGAAKRLGAVTARTLHARGYRVIIHHHTSSAEARALVRELNAARADSAVSLRRDLSQPDGGAATIGAAMRAWDRLDLLVNNAAVFDRTPLEMVAPEAWDRIQSINVRAPYFLSVSAAPFLRDTRGSIVNIADIHADRPRPLYSAYCISKAGVIAVTRALARELAPAVRVNCVAPGAILWADSEDEVLRAETVQATPLRRHGDPQDIAEAVCYLAAAQFVTGETVSVDGGLNLGA